MKRILLCTAVVTALLIAALCFVFRPNGDVGAFIQHPATAAWIQAVGSIVAILSAIWIDRGSARRAIEKDERAARAAVKDWAACLLEVRDLSANAAAQVAGDKMSDVLDDQFAGRLVDNSVMMIDIYLRQMPPDPTLAFALSAARSYLEIPRDAIRRRREMSDTKLFKGSFSTRLELAGRVRETMHDAAANLEALWTQYRNDLL